MGLLAGVPGANLVQAGAGIVQAGIGAVQSIAANARLKRLMKQRTTYTSPDEYNDLNNMATYNAQTGFGAGSLDYFSTQTNRALSSSLGAATKLGGDPNSVADIFNTSVMAIMKTTSDNELLKLQKFDKVYETVRGLAEQKTAEWADKEALLKDKMAAQAMKVAAGNKNLQSGLNMALGAVANKESGDLYSNSGFVPPQNAYAAAPALLTTPATAMRTTVTTPDWLKDYQHY